MTAMTYQYKREPLSVEEADRFLNAGQTLTSLRGISEEVVLHAVEQ